MRESVPPERSSFFVIAHIPSERSFRKRRIGICLSALLINQLNAERMIRHILQFTVCDILLGDRFGSNITPPE